MFIETVYSMKTTRHHTCTCTAQNMMLYLTVPRKTCEGKQAKIETCNVYWTISEVKIPWPIIEHLQDKYGEWQCNKYCITACVKCVCLLLINCCLVVWYKLKNNKIGN